MNKRFIKIISVIVLAVFIANTVPVDLAYSRSEDEYAAYQYTSSSESTINVENVLIPKRLGYVDSRFNGESGKVVFHIKDAHCNYAAQKAVYGLIDWIVKKYDVSLVNLEGATGDYDLDILENIKDPFVKRDIVNKYMKSGRVTGAESYRAFHPEKVQLAGIENTDLYEDNLLVYRTILEYKDKIDEFLSKAASIFDAVKEEAFSADLKTFLNNQILFDSNNIRLEKYLPYLFRMATKYSYPIEKTPNLVKLSDLLVKERDIDFEKAEHERQIIVSILSERLSKYERLQLLSSAELYESGQITEGEFHVFLVEKAKEVGIDDGSYPNLYAYSKYLAVYGGIDEEVLFTELSQIEDGLSEALCSTEKERRVLGYIRQVQLLKKMFDLKLNRQELESAKRTVNIAEVLSFLKASADEISNLEEAALYVSYGFSNMTVFYALADKRDETFVYNVRQNMLETGAEASILVTGGFHSKNLHDILEANGISYIAINPEFVNEQGYVSPYMNLLSGNQGILSEGALSFLASTIQIKSLWSNLGIDTDFAASFLLRVNAAIDVAKSDDKEGIVVSLGDRVILLLRSMGYRPAPNVPRDYDTNREYSVISIPALMGMTDEDCMKRLYGFMDPSADLEPASGYTGNKDMADILRELFSRESNTGVDFAKGIARKRAYLRTYEGQIVEQQLRGMGDVDTFDYILDVPQGVLTCQFSCSRTFSGYMSNPSTVRGKNEKSYMCRVLRRLYRPGITPTKQKEILEGLIEEQREYASRGECGWQWVIDMDENGEIIVNDTLGYGLRSLRIFDRSKLPENIEAQNLEADADKYGSTEMVQEMLFDISPMKGDKVRIKLINSWAAQEAKYRDQLTGLFNKWYFEHKVNPRLTTMSQASILFIDIDKFKRFNDTYPEKHTFGDRVLTAVSNAILRTVRGSDVVFRWGGEEFMVVIPEATAVNAKIVAHNIQTNVKKLRPEGLRENDEIAVTIGVRGIEKENLGNAMEAIQEADKAMMEAKARNMRGTIIMFGEELPVQYRSRGAKAGETTTITRETITKDINDITGLYYPALMRNLQEFCIQDMVPGKSQGTGLKSIFMDLNKPEFIDKLSQIEAFGTVLFEKRARKSAEMVEFIARKQMRRLYLSFDRIRKRIYSVVGDSPATKRVKNAMEAVEHIMDLTFKYLTEEDLKDLGIIGADTKADVSTPDKAESEDMPPENGKDVGGKMLSDVLERLEILFNREVASGFEERVMSDDDFSETASDVLDSEMYSGSSHSEQTAREKEETVRRKKNVDTMGQWLSRLMLGAARFPKETRIIAYPVYNETVFAKEVQMASELKRRMYKGDYGFSIVPLPYLAGDSSRDKAIGTLLRLVDEDENARALIFADGKFFDQNNGELKTKYKSRIFCIKEEGEIASETFTSVPFYIRSALALSVMDLFDKRNNLKRERRARLKDMIAAILGIITKDSDIIDAFKQAPGRLVNGMIVLKPAERVSWKGFDEKMRASEQFLHSL
jgi:diguanylate cyclase (GGDEF)-like protein